MTADPISLHANVCAFDGCGRPIRSKGLCNGHHQQQLRGETLRPLRQRVARTAHLCPHPESADCYTHHGCRCTTCCTAHTRQHKTWRHQAATCGSLTTDPTGTVRRLRALCRVGWSRPELGEHLGICRAAVEALIAGRRTTVTIRVRDAVAAMYDALWEGPGVPTPGAEKARRSRAIGAARRHGWAPPLAWDDDMDQNGIDNPAATPFLSDAAETTFERIKWLVDGGQSLATITSQLGITASAVEKACRRSGEIDVWERINIGRKAA